MCISQPCIGTDSGDRFMAMPNVPSVQTIAFRPTLVTCRDCCTREPKVSKHRGGEVEDGALVGRMPLTDATDIFAASPDQIRHRH